MSRHLLYGALFLASITAHANSTDDAYKAGADFGKNNRTQGTAVMGGGAPDAVVPGYTDAPAQKNYYSGVTSSGSELAGEGQTETGRNEAALSIQDSILKNPATVIDPDATFLTAGKETEANADAIAGANGGMCSLKVVTKTKFENRQCDKDVNVFSACSRTATIALKEEVTQDTVDERSAGKMPHSHLIQNTGTLKQAILTVSNIELPITMCNKLQNGSGKPCPGFSVPRISFMGKTWPVTVTQTPVIEYNGRRAKPGEASFSVTLDNLSQGVRVGEALTAAITASTYRYSSHSGHGDRWETANTVDTALASGDATITLKVFTTIIKRTPIQDWKTNCPQGAGSLASTQCVAPSETRSAFINGVTYSLYADCWEYQDEYVTAGTSDGTCSELAANKDCTIVSRACTESTGNVCSHEAITYQCQTSYSSTGQLCGGDFFCQSGDCEEIGTGASSGFDEAISKLAGLANAGDAIRDDQINVRAFTGESKSCRKAMAGFSNCCKDSGWGNSVGLAHCSSDEKALGKAKNKKLVVSLGETCARKGPFGICLQKKQVYCQFGSKLSRIIQEQGRRGQLNISFGSAGSPDCRGITVDELGRINFDLINFSDFYEDLENNKNIPDQGALLKRAKELIANQVNKVGGGQ